jgi:outer membrane protein assembly factor BamA
MGNLWGSYKDWAPWKPDGYLFSFGIGIQINIPMIPIRFYMARRGWYNNGNWELLGNQQFFEYWTPVLAIQGLF